VTVPDTGWWQTWTTVRRAGVALAAGPQGVVSCDGQERGHDRSREFQLHQRQRTKVTRCDPKLAQCPRPRDHAGGETLLS
jgi:hypothetical protein